jgi:His/Glu/Gln/Arg/opine family amino acid ABC transporter permease subunit
MWAQWAHVLASGLVVTLELTGVISVCTIVFSLLLASAAVSEIKPLARCCRLYSDVVRSIPLLPALIFVYYGLGRDFVQIGVNTFWLACLVFVLSESGYQAEIYRGIFRSMGAGQWEAGRSLGLRWRQIVTRVLLPSCLPAIIPVSVNAVVLILKDTSLASMITIQEVTLSANGLVSTSFQPLQVYILLAGFYLVVVLPIMGLSQLLERRLTRGARRPGIMLGTGFPGARRPVPLDLTDGKAAASAGRDVAGSL